MNESERVFRESGELLWWTDDSHWNHRGQDVAAGVVFEALRDVLFVGGTSGGSWSSEQRRGHKMGSG